MQDITAIYLDDAATTRPDSRVVDAMLPWWMNRHGNAASRHHHHGQQAACAVDYARAQVAAAIHADPAGMIFTSGATESNNMALRGVMPFLRQNGKTHVITSAVEHKSVLATLDDLCRDGISVTVLPVKPCGMIEAAQIEQAITPQTGLVSVQAVNNELGTIQPVHEIARMLRGRGIFLHVDAAQGLGRVHLDVQESEIDFMSLSAHKAYGPQGIGALYARPGLLCPVQTGGGQQNNMRGGTVPVALCVGFGAACALLDDDRQRLQDLRDMFLERIRHLNPEIFGHTDPAWNVPGILNIRFAGIDQETLVMSLPGLSFGVGAACSSASGASHVLRAITGSDIAARESIRISFGRFTTQDHINQASGMISDAVSNIRSVQEVA